MTRWEVGDKYVGGVNGDCRGEIIAVAKYMGQPCYWVQPDNSCPFTPGDEFVSTWRKVLPFFEEGKTYKWVSGDSTAYAYRVLHITEFGGRKWAIAGRFLQSLETYVTALDANDFKNMREIND